MLGKLALKTLQNLELTSVHLNQIIVKKNYGCNGLQMLGKALRFKIYIKSDIYPKVMVGNDGEGWR